MEVVMRIDKFISGSTPFSRKEIKKLIKDGTVTVNGIAVKSPDTKVSESDDVAINGESVAYKKYVYLVLDKPAGYVCAVDDKRYRCVTELVPEEYAHYGVYPVGRLDIDTEGLIILTNDGEFAHNVASPRKNVRKRYFARLDKAVESSDADRFAEGMEFKDFTAKPAVLELTDEPCEAYVEISEGKYHQVKRMFARVGKEVLFLRRTAIGGLELPEDSEPGDIFESDRDSFEKIINSCRDL